MLTIRDLKMSVGGRTLFEQASLNVNYGDRVALVGPNGAGKSTLFSLILKTQAPDEGVIERDHLKISPALDVKVTDEPEHSRTSQPNSNHLFPQS